MEQQTRTTPKAPRWITTDAGLQAWEEYEAWRKAQGK